MGTRALDAERISSRTVCFGGFQDRAPARNRISSRCITPRRRPRVGTLADRDASNHLCSQDLGRGARLDHEPGRVLAGALLREQSHPMRKISSRRLDLRLPVEHRRDLHRAHVAARQSFLVVRHGQRPSHARPVRISKPVRRVCGSGIASGDCARDSRPPPIGLIYRHRSDLVRFSRGRWIARWIDLVPGRNHRDTGRSLRAPHDFRPKLSSRRSRKRRSGGALHGHRRLGDHLESIAGTESIFACVPTWCGVPSP